MCDLFLSLSLQRDRLPVSSPLNSWGNNWKSTFSNLHSAVNYELQLDGRRKGFTHSVCPLRFPMKLPRCDCMQKLLAAAPAESHGSKPREVRDALSAILVHVCASLWHLRSAQRLCRDGRWVRVRERRIFFIYIYIYSAHCLMKEEKNCLLLTLYLQALEFTFYFFTSFTYFLSCQSFTFLHHLWAFIPFLCLISLNSLPLLQPSFSNISHSSLLS